MSTQAAAEAAAANDTHEQTPEQGAWAKADAKGKAKRQAKRQAKADAKGKARTTGARPKKRRAMVQIVNPALGGYRPMEQIVNPALGGAEEQGTASRRPVSRGPLSYYLTPEETARWDVDEMTRRDVSEFATEAARRFRSTVRITSEAGRCVLVCTLAGPPPDPPELPVAPTAPKEPRTPKGRPHGKRDASASVLPPVETRTPKGRPHGKPRKP